MRYSGFERVFTLLDPETKVTFYAEDGKDIKKGELIAKVHGDIRVLLSGERTALNYLQRMSGVATYTRKVASLLEGTNTTLLDTRKMSPTKPTQLMLEKYPIEEKIEMEYFPRKIAISGEERQEESLVIQRHHLDCNNHVNNGQYIKIAGAYLPKEFKIRQMRAEYRKQAYLGSEVFPYIYENEDKVIISLCDSRKQPYVVVEFQSRS